MAVAVRCAGISLVALAVFLQAFGIATVIVAHLESGWPVFAYSIPAAFLGSLLVALEPTKLGTVGAKLSLSVVGAVVVLPVFAWLALLIASLALG